MKLFGIDCGSGKLSDQLFYLTYGLMTKAGFICWGGGGGPSPAASPSATSQTQTISAISPWAQPGISAIIGQEMANQFPNQTTNPDGSINLGQQLGYTAFGQNGVGIGPGQMQAAQAAVAPTSALQNQSYSAAAGLQTPSQYGQATGLAGAAGMGSLNTVGQAAGYGAMGAQAGANASGQSSMYGMQGSQAGQQAGALSNMYGAAGAMTGANAANASNQYGQMGVNTGQQAAGMSNMYGQMGVNTGQQAAGMSNMYGQGAVNQGQQGAAIGASLGQQSQNASTGPGSVYSYMNPYLNASLAPQLALQQQQFGQLQAQNQGAATQANAFGGGRSDVMTALNQQNEMLAQNQLTSNAYNTAFNNAQSQMNAANQAALTGNAQAQTGYGQGLTAAQQAGTLGLAGTAQGLQGAQQAGTLGMQGTAQGLTGAQQAGNLGIAGANAGLQGAQQAGTLGLSGINAGLSGAQQAGTLGLAGTAQGLQGVQQAGQLGLAGIQSGLTGAQQAGQLGISGAQTGLSGAQQAGSLGMQGAAVGLSGVNAQQAGYAGAGTQASNLANIGTQNLAAQTSILGTQNTLGAQQQAQQQAVINQAIQNYANTQNYPMQQAYNLEGLYTGTGATANQTQTQYQAAPSLVNTAAGLGTAAIGASKLLAAKKGGKVKGFAAGGIASLATGGSAPADTSDSGSSLAGTSLQAMFNTFVNGPQSAIDAQLQSKTPSMEQTAAMLANQKRKELQTAAQGRQAGMQAQQPTVKDQMLAQDMAKRQAALQQMYSQQPEPQQLQAQPAAQQQQMAQNPVKEEGLDQLPAPTLKTMAGGGIIAFKNGTVDETVGAAANSQTQTDPNALYIPPVSDTDKKIWNAITHPADTLQAVKDWMYSDPQSKMVSKAQSGTLTQADINAASAPAATAPAALSEANQSKFTPSQLDQAISNNAGINKLPAAGPTNAPAGGIKDLTTARSPQPPVPAPAPQPTFTPAPDRFADMAMTQEAMDKKVASEKNSATADFLMNMGFKMATTVGPLGKATGEGGIAALPGLAASRKTINELEKQRQDFNFNVAKAQEAKQNGDEQLAFHYAKQADDKAQQMGMLAVHNRMADADMIKASAMANSVGSKADIIQQRTDAAVLKAASDIHDKNMANMLFQQKFAKMSPMERNQYFNDVRGQARSLAGQDSGTGALGSGISMDAIDAAIAKKSKS